LVHRSLEGRIWRGFAYVLFSADQTVDRHAKPSNATDFLSAQSQRIAQDRQSLIAVGLPARN
jgi:hypothetical protein